MSFCRAQKKRKKTAGGPTGFWKEMKTGPWLLGVFGVPERTFQGFTTGETDKNWDGTQVLTRIPPMNANELQMDATERGIRGVGREDF